MGFPQTNILEQGLYLDKISERSMNLAESALCASSLKHFAKSYVYLQNQNTKRVEKWLPWDYLIDLIDIYFKYDYIFILKASQLGLSWLFGGIIPLWTSLFNETAKCLLLSQGQTEAKELLDKASFIYERLPDFLKTSAFNDTQIFFRFRNTRSEIKALPSTEKAGHGYQASLVVRDELARHEYARENFKAVSRAIDSGGKLIELSTANKSQTDNYFQEKTSEFLHAEGTVKEVLKSGLEIYTNPSKPAQCLVFLGWKLRPTRLEGLSLDDWFETRIKTRYTPFEIEEQYPSTIEDIFHPSVSLSYFDYKSLDDMGYDITQPIRQSEIDTMGNIVRVYKLPDKSRRYVIYTDPSDGSEDPFVTGVMDYVTGEVVCTACGKIKVDIAASIHDGLVKVYNNALNSFEYNSVGIAFSQCLDNLKTPNPAPRYKLDKQVYYYNQRRTDDYEKRGQYVSAEFKRETFGDLALAVIGRKFVIHDREFSQQAKLVKRDDNGYPVTNPHLSFDWVMMMAGLWLLQKKVPKGDIRLTTYVPTRGGYVPARAA